MNLTVYDLNTPGNFRDIEYDDGSVLLETIVKKFNPKLSPKNTNLAIGKRVFLNWEIPIDACLFYGDSVSLFFNLEKRNTIETDFGGDFADLTKGKKFEWNKNAPQYRIASRGLCLEGTCTNSRCEAYGNMVDINNYF